MPTMSCSLPSMSESRARAAHSAASCSSPAAAYSSALRLPSGSRAIILRQKKAHNHFYSIFYLGLRVSVLFTLNLKT